MSPVDLDQDRRRFRGFLTRFAQVPDDEWAFIEPEVALATYARGEHVVHQGGSAARVVFILQGLMRAFYTSPRGDEATRNFAVEDDVISAYAGALTGKPSNVTIEALEPTRALTLTYDKFTVLFDRHPCWQQIGRRIAEQFYITRERHFYELMALDAQARYELFLEENPGLVGRVPQKYIASYLGIAPESLSRLRRKLAPG